MAGPRAIDAVYGCCQYDGHATSVRNRAATAKGARVAGLRAAYNAGGLHRMEDWFSGYGGEGPVGAAPSSSGARTVQFE